MSHPNKQREVAVVVPCYNAARRLARALDSVLAQTHTDFRLYMIDDGSTDETLKILERYSSYGVPVHQQHAGPAAARNRGIRMSSSPYIAFLDADDYWIPKKLERQIAVLKQNPGVGLVCSDCATWKRGEAAASFFENSDVPQTGKLFERLARGCFIFTPTVMVRRECLENTRLFNESLVTSEDYNLWLRIAARWEISVVPEVLAVREICPTGLSLGTKPEIYLENSIAALQDVNADCSELLPGERRALERAIAERQYVYGSHLLASGFRTGSRKQLADALRCQPAHWRAWMKLGLSCLPGGSVRQLMELRRRFV